MKDPTIIPKISLASINAKSYGFQVLLNFMTQIRIILWTDIDAWRDLDLLQYAHKMTPI